MNHLLNNELEQYIRDIPSSLKSGLATWYGEYSLFGKRIFNNIWIHSSQMTNSPLKRLLGLLDDSNFIEDIVLRFSSNFEDLSILHYPGFLHVAHPSLCCSVLANLGSARCKSRSYSTSENPPILHRKELLVSPTHALYNKFRRLTEIEERYGLYREKRRIGWTKYWNQLLESKGLEIRKHELFEKHADI